jgi:hypothetical protein
MLFQFTAPEPEGPGRTQLNAIRFDELNELNELKSHSAHSAHSINQSAHIRWPQVKNLQWIFCAGTYRFLALAMRFLLRWPWRAPMVATTIGAIMIKIILNREYS